MNCWFEFLRPDWTGWEIEKSKIIRSFDVIKTVYILCLVPYHINSAVYLSNLLPYQTSTHGVEYMQGLLFISGWLSNSTTKPGTVFVQLAKKKLVRLLPSYFFGALPVTLVCIIWESIARNPSSAQVNKWEIGIQYVLECFTIGSLNPALMFWTRNRPLWFLSVLLTYHYSSIYYLNWLRSFSSNLMLALFTFGLIIFRLITMTAVLKILVLLYPNTYMHYSRIIHLWFGTQMFLPFTGAGLYELCNRIGPLKWSRNSIWRATDACTLTVFCLSFFLLAPPIYTRENKDSLFNYYLDALCAYGDLIIWPFVALGLYLHSHDFSTFTWLYSCYPRLFNDGLAISYPLYLMHWPIMLMLKESGAIDMSNTFVSVLVITATCILISLLLSRYVITPIESIICDYFNSISIIDGSSPLSTSVELPIFDLGPSGLTGQHKYTLLSNTAESNIILEETATSPLQFYEEKDDKFLSSVKNYGTKSVEELIDDI